MYNFISLFNAGAWPRTHMDPHDHCCRACQASLQWQTVMAVLQDLCPDLGAYTTAVAAAEYGLQHQGTVDLLSQIETLGIIAHSRIGSPSVPVKEQRTN